MKFFNIPADFNCKTIDRYVELNNKYEDSKIIETYGQITIGNRIGSGRAYDLIPSVDMKCLEEYVQYSKCKGIDFNYTLNTTCMSNMEFSREGISNIIKFLDDLSKVGVKSLTVALPSLIELIRVKGYDFEIKSSTVCQIINPNKALAYKALGVDKIVIDESINRDFEALKRIRNAFGKNVEVITNVICHKNCIYEMFHHNQTSHDIGTNSQASSATYYSHRCMMKRCENVGNLLRLGWIRPEDIKYYTGIGINYFKLQGRQAVLKGDPVRAVEAYIKESFEGNFMELLDMFSPTNSFKVNLDNKSLDGFIKPFYENMGFCKNDCTSCRYCDNFVYKCTDYNKTEKMFELALKFYNEYDNFIKDVKGNEDYLARKNGEVKKLFEENKIDMDFDFK